MKMQYENTETHIFKCKYLLHNDIYFIELFTTTYKMLGYIMI